MGQAKIKAQALKQHLQALKDAIEIDDEEAFAVAMNFIEAHVDLHSFEIEKKYLCVYIANRNAPRCLADLFGRSPEHTTKLFNKRGFQYAIDYSMLLHTTTIDYAKTLPDPNAFLRNCLSKFTADDLESFGEAAATLGDEMKKAFKDETVHRQNANVTDILDGHIRHVEPNDSEIKPKKSKIF